MKLSVITIVASLSMQVSRTSAFTVRQSSIIRSAQPLHRHYSFLGGLFEGPTIAPPEQIKKALNNPKAVLVDVRSPGEIGSNKVQYKNLAWINAPGTPFDCPALSEGAEQLLPDKKAPVVLYCASGKRAQKAKSILEQQGYEYVFNAGGMKDLKQII